MGSLAKSVLAGRFVFDGNASVATITGKRQALSRREFRQTYFLFAFSSLSAQITNRTRPMKVPTTKNTGRMIVSLFTGFALYRSSDIDALSQFLAGFEMRYVLGRNQDGCAGLWVAPFARRTIVKAEAAESAYLYPIPLGQGMRYAVQEGAD